MVLTSPSCFQEGKKLSRSLAELAFGSQTPAPKVMGRKGWKHTAQGEGARPIARGDNSPNLMGLSSFLVGEWWRLGNAQLEPHSPALHSPCGPGVLSLWVPKRSGPPQALHIYQGGSCLSSFLVFLHQQEWLLHSRGTRRLAYLGGAIVAGREVLPWAVKLHLKVGVMITEY